VFEKPVTRRSYIVGLVVLFAAAYSQYLIEGLGLIDGMLIVYGIPILCTALLWRSMIIRRALNRTYMALKFGLGFFGAFTVLGIVASSVLFYLIAAVDPNAVNLLNRPNPVLNISPELAWIMVWLSILVVGPAEEYLFRGFMFGGLLSLFKNRHWLSVAFLSSLLFAAVHLYYAFTYGIASVIQFTDLVTFGFAMAATYYVSGGNLLIPALIHGIYDATAFVGVAISMDVGNQLRGYMILICVIVAVILLVQRGARRKVPFQGVATQLQ
jgi:membrane protease YdiL (CAAX protease family)